MAGSNLHTLLYMAERLKTRRCDGASAALPYLAQERLPKRPTVDLSVTKTHNGHVQ